jgi:hypothetical protein
LSDGKVVGGFSVRLAKSNVPKPKPVKAGPVHFVSKQVAVAAPPPEPSPRVFELAAPLALEATRQSIPGYLATQRIDVT